jgi:maltose-binding protein MalE
LLGLLAVLTLVIAACGGGEATDTTAAVGAETTAAGADTTAAAVETTMATETTAATDTTAGATDSTAAAAGGLVIWADELRARVLEEISPPFTDATGVSVDIQIVDFANIREQVTTQAPAGEGPDIFVGGHDWTGELAANGILEPIDLGAMTDEFFDVSLSAFTFDGQLYAVPYGYEAIALYYNTDLVPEPPATIEEMPAICEGLDQVENCIGLPGGGDTADAYHHFPFISADGGYIFRYDPATGFDPSDVGLDNEGAIQGVTVLQGLVDDGVIGSVNYDTAKNLFLEGSEPFWITGPWELGTLNEEATTVNWGVAKLPTIDGNAPAPFVGAQGFFVNAFSENKVLATSYLLDYVATPETMTALYEADYRLPTITTVFDAVAADDPVVQTFNESVADGIPMPNIPEMAAVWAPLGDQLLLLRNGELNAEAALTAAATQVREAVGAN